MFGLSDDKCGKLDQNPTASQRSYWQLGCQDSPLFPGLILILILFRGFNVKRTVFRSLIVALLLFLAESLPSFSAILQLVSSIFVTCLTFIFPPLFYMRLVAKSADSKEWKQWSLGIGERIMCYQAIIIGLFGGVLSFISSIKYIKESSYVPCYMQEMERSC